MKNILLIVMMGIGLISYSQTDWTKYEQSKISKVCENAKWQTTQNVTYDGSYRIIDYPWGDVPENIGVCTDVVIRAFRAVGIDLQEHVHKSVVKNHKYYYPNPKPGYGLKPDANIDHRRVRVLHKYFKLHFPEAELSNSDTWMPGDLIIWQDWHIGILIDEKVEGTDRYYVVHNMGAGPIKEDLYYDMIVPFEYGIKVFRVLKFYL
jgi:uncharacterized protein YijF (DUF1287 family)